MTNFWLIHPNFDTFHDIPRSTLPPDSRTLVSKWNTKLTLIWKEDFGPLGNSPVLLLLSPGKTPLTTTVAKFIDTSVWWILMPWPQPQSITCAVHPNSCIDFIRLRFSWLVVHLFFPHFFLPLNSLLTCFDTALCEHPASLAMAMSLWLTLMWKVSMIVFNNCQISSLHHACVA